MTTLITTCARTMTTFDKLNLAFCAMERANAAVIDNPRRFRDEHQTAMVWAREASKSWSRPENNLI